MSSWWGRRTVPVPPKDPEITQREPARGSRATNRGIVLQGEGAPHSVAAMANSGRDAQWVMAEGHVLEYWDGGDPHGRPVLYHPGTPMTRVMGRWGHEAAMSSGVRLVAISRPGYGGSTITRTRPSLLATGRDTAGLATELGLSDYAVVGVSGGGPYAVATSVADPGRVRAVAVVAGTGPWPLVNIAEDDSPALAEERAVLARWDAGDEDGALAAYRVIIERDIGGLRDLDPDARVSEILGEFTGALALGNNPEYRALWAASMTDFAHGPEGYLSDNLAWGGRWDIDPRAVSAPTRLWYGENDLICPAAHAQWYVERIPGARLVVHPGESHMDVCDGHWPEVLDGLLEDWPAR
jgi:pimeloyl-ACP methyl ester carboxylesterase